jgi:hypothetical protein
MDTTVRDPILGEESDIPIRLHDRGFTTRIGDMTDSPWSVLSTVITTSDLLYAERGTSSLGCWASTTSGGETGSAGA